MAHVYNQLSKQVAEDQIPHVHVKAEQGVEVLEDDDWDAFITPLNQIEAKKTIDKKRDQSDTLAAPHSQFFTEAHDANPEPAKKPKSDNNGFHTPMFGTSHSE